MYNAQIKHELITPIVLQFAHAMKSWSYILQNIKPLSLNFQQRDDLVLASVETTRAYHTGKWTRDGCCLILLKTP
jgi:hypothetical protein